MEILFIKICFSLVYSIESLEAATIFKKVGRYYELILEQNIIHPGESRKIILKRGLCLLIRLHSNNKASISVFVTKKLIVVVKLIILCKRTVKFFNDL